MQGEETITLTKAKLIEITEKSVSKAVDKIWTEMSSSNVFAVNVDMEAHLQKILKPSLLEADLQLLFPELGLIRKNIVFKSFLINHTQQFDPSQYYDAKEIIALKFDKVEDTITICNGFEEGEIMEFELVNILDNCWIYEVFK
jgi:hypothetical protein